MEPAWSQGNFLQESHQQPLPPLPDANLTQKPAKGNVLFWTWNLAKKEELVEKMKITDRLGCSDCKTAEIKFLREDGAKSRNTALDFRAADFNLFRDLLKRILRDTWERREVQRCQLIIKDHLLWAQEGSSLTSKKSSKGSRRPAWVSKSYWPNWHKKTAYGRRKYRDTVWPCRDEVTKAKANVELNLAQAVKGNKKSFCKYINDKKKTGEVLCPVLNRSGELVTARRLRMT